jgi:outer membrane biogenesis lipoprotein LolB
VNFIRALLLALALTLLCACSEDRDQPSPLAGVWLRADGDRCVLRLWSNGRAAIIKDPNAEPPRSKWEASGDTLTITGPDGEVLAYRIVSVSKTRLALELANGEQSSYERFTP